MKYEGRIYSKVNRRKCKQTSQQIRVLKRRPSFNDVMKKNLSTWDVRLCLSKEESFFSKSPWANLRKYENVPWGILEIEISAIEVVFTWYQGPHRFLSNLRRCDYVNDLIFYSRRQFAKWRFAIIMCTEKRRICTPISSNFCIVVYSQNRLVLPKNANLYCCEWKCIFLVKGVISYSTRTNSNPLSLNFLKICKNDQK